MGFSLVFGCSIVLLSPCPSWSLQSTGQTGGSDFKASQNRRGNNTKQIKFIPKNMRFNRALGIYA